MIQSFYDYNKIPLWILNSNLELQNCFFSDSISSLKQTLTAHIEKLIANIPNPDFDIICYENELYYIFSFENDSKTFYILGGPMLLSAFIIFQL